MRTADQLPEELFGYSPKARFLVDVIPHLPARQREKAIGLSLQAARSCSGFGRVRMISEVTRVLEGPRRDAVVSEALRWLYVSAADSLSIAELVDAVGPCLNDDAARELRSFLIERLESDSPSEYDRWVRALLTLLPRIHDDQRDHLVRVLQFVQRIPEASSRTSTLIHLLPFLAEVDFEHALDLAKLLNHGLPQGRALMALIPYVTDDLQASEIIEEALDNLHGSMSRVELRKPASKLNGALLERVYHAVLEEDDVESRVEELIALISPARGKLLEQILESALDAVTKIEDKSELSRCLAMLGEGRPDWVQAHQSTLRPLLVRLLCDLASLPRAEYIEGLIALRTIWEPLISPGAAWEVAKNMIEVHWDWDWQ